MNEAVPIWIPEGLEESVALGTVGLRLERRGTSGEVPARVKVVTVAGVHDSAPGQAIAAVGRRARHDVLDSTWRLRRLVRRGRQVADGCMNHERAADAAKRVPSGCLTSRARGARRCGLVFPGVQMTLAEANVMPNDVLELLRRRRPLVAFCSKPTLRGRSGLPAGTWLA